MSTRGTYGFRKNGQDKLTYNHFDSYPGCLGRDILQFCHDVSIKDMDKLYDLIELINEDVPPTEEQIKTCQQCGYVDLSVSDRSLNDWYCLLYNLQGNFDAYKKAVIENKYIYMPDNHNFIKKSLWCEYGYIINLDNESLEFYVGFQKHPSKSGRYGTEENDGYYPCKFVLNIPIYAIKEASTIDKFVDKMDKIAKEEDS